MEKEKLFPIFCNKLDLICTMSDQQMCLVFRSISRYLKGESVEIQDEHTLSIYNLLISDFDMYNAKCSQIRERVAKKRERDKQQKTESTEPLKAERPKEITKPKESSDFSEDVKEIIDFLNLTAGTHYKYNAKSTTKHIRARLAEGFTVDDFKTVISKMYNVWKNTDMFQYYRPETLFNSEKFESYLNRTDKTEAELKQEKSYNEQYGWMERWMQESDDDDQSGIYADNSDDRGYLPDFSA